MTMFRVPWGRVWRDGGILDFGREHVFLAEDEGDEVVLPQSLVTFIAEQAVNEYLSRSRSEQHVGAREPGAPDAGDG